MKGFRFSGLISLGILAGLFETASAQPVINGSFYEESKTFACANNTQCLLFFTEPSSRVRFTKVTCALANFNVDVYEIYFGVYTDFGFPRRIDFLPFEGPRMNGSLRNYALNEQIDFLFAAGKVPQIVATRTGTGAGTLSCKLTGRFE